MYARTHLFHTQRKTLVYRLHAKGGIYTYIHTHTHTHTHIHMHMHIHAYIYISFHRKKKNTPLHVACEKGHVQAIQVLAGAGASQKVSFVSRVFWDKVVRVIYL